jgi:uncharacterized protein (TIGR03435 family)
MKVLVAVAIAGVAALPSVSARQNPTRVAFEVASVKPNLSGAAEAASSTPPAGTIAITNTPLKSVIINSYRVRPFQVIGAPAWTETERFDILAKPPADATPEQVPVMMRTLLAARFGLRAHMETSEQPIYALRRARADGQLGPQLKRATVDCTGNVSSPPPNTAGNTNRCRARMSISDAGGAIDVVGRPLSSIMDTLGIVTSRVVVDQTMVTGPVDLRLEWSSETAADRPALSNGAPGIFTAVQEQLGLKLEPARGPVEVLVIDSVERPTPD